MEGPLPRSRRPHTVKDVGPNWPIEVSGFRRAWIARGPLPGFNTTYLGITADPSDKMNAVVYRVPHAADVKQYDQRESGYCRVLVPRDHIKLLAKKKLLSGQYWVYAMPQSVANIKPTRRYPIVQSYVDLLISGCLNLQKKFKLPGFAKACITTTHGWSKHWVNDRIYPRRPFIYQPMAWKIDTLLKTNLPKYFAAIHIE